MGYTLQFGQVTPYLGQLAAGAWLTLQIAAIAFAAGWLIGIVCASVLYFGRAPLRRVVRGYVVFFLNTPLLVVLDSYQAVCLGMSLNAGAYMTEIQRAGFASVRRQELDAAETLGFTRLQAIRYVIVPHIVRVLFPEFMLLVESQGFSADEIRRMNTTNPAGLFRVGGA